MEPDANGLLPLLTVAEACQELRTGHFVLITDALHLDNLDTDSIDHQSGPAAALCLAAQFATPERTQHSWQMSDGDLYTILPAGRLDALHIFPEQPHDPFQGDQNGTTTHSETANAGKSSSIPFEQYSALFRALANPATQPDDPAFALTPSVLRPHPGGVLQRQSYTDGVFDLIRCAGVEPVAVVGQVTTQQALRELVQRQQIGVLTLDELLRYRHKHQLSFITATSLPTRLATFRLLHFQEIETGQPYLACLLGDLSSEQSQPPLLRIHSACATGDIFGSQRCDCQAQLHSAIQTIAHAGRGILLYLPQEGRGIGLAGKLQAYVLQEQGYDTLEANEQLGYPVDARSYNGALEILRELGITRARLLTNNPEKVTALQRGGIATDRMPLQILPTTSNQRYLLTKQQRMGHLLTTWPDEILAGYE
jgi:3,4-dihydroxy 2-butanone 4-phosphate synthase/GTP cyclohydrolase II